MIPSIKETSVLASDVTKRRYFPIGVVHCIRFDPSRFSRVKWKNSKRLMYGNLVCLSH